MSLDVSLEVKRPVEIFEYNITHNLNKMADAAGIYKELWHPSEIGIIEASQLIEPLTRGLKELLDNPEKYKAFNPDNGWGCYEDLCSFVQAYLNACKANPEARVRAYA